MSALFILAYPAFIFNILYLNTANLCGDDSGTKSDFEEYAHHISASFDNGALLRNTNGPTAAQAWQYTPDN